MPNHLGGATARSFLSLILTFLLGLPPGARLVAQQEPLAPATLNIVIVEGEGVINSIRHRSARKPVVRVEDANHRPVADATVLFTLPDSGPGGVFANGSRTLLVRTDRTGRAEAKRFRVNDVQGKFQIRVRASSPGGTATASITQLNSVLRAGAGARRLRGKHIAILAAIGAAVAVGVFLATRNRSTEAPSISISPGTPTVGGP